MNGPVERTFSIVDVAGFTALTESHGDVHAADLAEHLISTSRALLTDQDVLDDKFQGVSVVVGGE